MHLLYNAIIDMKIIIIATLLTTVSSALTSTSIEISLQ